MTNKIDQNSTTGMKSFRKKAIEIGAIIAVGLPVSLGLGYAWEVGNKKEAERWHERLTDSQRSVIQAAADADECGIINPRVSRLCMYVKNGEMSLYPAEKDQISQPQSRSLVF